MKPTQQKLATVFSLLICLFLLAVPALKAQPRVYNNDRYGFKLSVPEGFMLTSQSDNGDGAVFTNADAEATLTAYAGHNVQNLTPRWAIDMELSRTNGSHVLVKERGDNYFILAWQNSKRITYLKTYICADYCYSVEIAYPVLQNKAMTKNVRQIIFKDGFVPGPMH